MGGCATSKFEFLDQTRPVFGVDINGVVAAVKPICDADKEAFMKKYISKECKDYGSDFAKSLKDNNSKVREIQYSRWRWAQANMDIYINTLRVSGFSDKQIQDMLNGCPLCFHSPAAYKEFSAACAELCHELETADVPVCNLRMVATGSSVVGFSQNPLKGITNQASKITCPQSSDVDICLVADGITDWIKSLKLTTKQHRMYPSTSSPNLSVTRIGLRPSTFKEVMPQQLSDFYKLWGKKLPGGLQITFQESGNDLPPWEIHMPLANV